MKYQGLEDMAVKGQLEIYKHYVGQFKRAKYIYSKEPDILDQKLLKVKYVSFARYFYSARTPEMKEHQSYKITAVDYKNLLKAGAKEI